MMRTVSVVPLPLLLLLVAGAGGSWRAQAAEGAPEVATRQGRVSGLTEHSVKGRAFYSYYGLPYAKPPVGALRFKDPVAGGGWEGVRDGSRKPPPCPQVSFSAMMGSREVQEENFVGDEDCVYLNVFTPQPQEDAGLPVMVWIHGGGFFSGSGLEYQPHVLLDHDVVLVVVQYRLGVLGFLSTEDDVMPGNLGLKDQTLALRWVQNNIAHFGGDRTRVTIFGESAGGASVHYQMLVPDAAGLFTRAIAQSGTSLCPWALSHEHAKDAARIAEAVGCPADQGSHELLSCLQEVDTRTLLSQLLDLFDWFMMPIRLGPRVDGRYLPAPPGLLVREGRVARVALMSGTTRDEGGFIVKPLFSMEALQRAMSDNFRVAGPSSLQLNTGHSQDPAALAARIFHRYLGPDAAPTDKDKAEQLQQMYSHYLFQVSQDEVSIRHAHLGSTYSYDFGYRGQLSMGNFFPTDVGQHWVPHADDIFYLFPGGLISSLLSADPTLPSDIFSPEDLAFRDVVTKLWTNFAATGDPTPDSSLGFKWEAVTPEKFHHLSLTSTPAMTPDTRAQDRKWFASLPTKMNEALQPHLVRPLPHDDQQQQQPRNEL